MTYYPLDYAADDRRAACILPRRMQNCMVVRAPKTARRGGYAVVPTPGLTRRATPSTNKNLRGVFRKDGVLNGLLFCVAGDSLYSVDENWTCTFIGIIAGADFVQWTGLGTTLYVAGGGFSYKWDGATFSVVSGTYVPFPIYTLAALGNRLIVSQQNTDTNSWSATADGTTFPALAFAASEIRADRIEGAIVVGSDYWSMGRESWQILTAKGGPDESAIGAVSDFVKEVGLINRNTLSPFDRTAAWIANDRVPRIARGFEPVPVINQALTNRLTVMTTEQIAGLSGFTYSRGEKWLWSIRMSDGGTAMVYDQDVRDWHERSTKGADIWAQAFAVDAYGKTVVAGPNDDALWTLEDDVYTDDGLEVERRMTVFVPLDGNTPIDNITLDIKTKDQPLAGEHANPAMLMRTYHDGGTSDSVRRGFAERTFRLGPRGSNERPMQSRFGTFNGVDGALFEFITTAPCGFAFSGIHVNSIQKNPL